MFGKKLKADVQQEKAYWIGPDVALAPAEPEIRAFASAAVSTAEGFRELLDEGVPEAPKAEPEKGEPSEPPPLLDLRFTRSYLFLPIPDEALKTGQAHGLFASGTASATGTPHEGSPEFIAISRISAVLDSAERTKQPFTDIVVMSHGWHRNLFGALSAYDRLSSLFLDLAVRNRLDPLDRSPASFRPLLVGVHYHSDPGQDDWVDYSGRRDRESFLRNARERLDPAPGKSEGQLTVDFEELFDLFSKIAAPGVDPASRGMTARARELGGLLQGYTLAGSLTGKLATPDEVLTVAWACYHEADPVPQTEEQTDVAEPSLDLGQWALRVFNIAIKVLAMAGLLAGLISKGFLGMADTATRLIEGWLSKWAPSWLNVYWPWVLGAILYLACWLGLAWVVQAAKSDETPDGGKLDRTARHVRQHRGTRFWGSVFYLPLQIVHIAPILVWCLLSPFFASGPGVVLAYALGAIGPFLLLTRQESTTFMNALQVHPWATGWGLLYAALAFGIWQYFRHGYQTERLNLSDGGVLRPNALPWLIAWPGTLKKALVGLAMLPIRLAKRAARPNQTWVGIWQNIENQVAFWWMADKAVRAGGWVGAAVERATANRGIRVHLFGHSHGGLVVCNAARWFTRRVSPSRGPKGSQVEVEAVQAIELQTLATINGAYRSDWLDGQDAVIDGITGCAASLYSARDVANSLWYPLANLGRKASGSVGFCLSRRKEIIGEPLPSVSVSDAKYEDFGKPELRDRLLATRFAPQSCKVLNVDVSRFVFRGPALPQGAHGDVYSKDVVATVWRVMQFSDWRRAGCP